MQLHQISPIKKQKAKRRIGRGGKRGTYSGKGIKGQKSRAGAKIKPQWRELVKKLPKQRGIKFKGLKERPVIVNLSVIEKFFKAGEIVSPATLISRGLAQKKKGRVPPVKILGDGDLTRKIEIRNCLVSETVKEKIKKAGGIVRS